MIKTVTGSFSLAAHVFCVCASEREREQSTCGGLINTDGGCACICVSMCVSSSARAVSLILHAHREWRMTGEYTAGGGHVMLIAIFATEYFLAWVDKGKEEKMINKRCNLLQGTGSHWRMRA